MARLLTDNNGDEKDVYDALQKMNPDAYVARGLAEAFIGHTIGKKPAAVYDYDTCIDIVMSELKVDEKGAAKYLEETTIPSISGHSLPVFIVITN
jgi:hypothetical protein